MPGIVTNAMIKYLYVLQHIEIIYYYDALGFYHAQEQWNNGILE